MEEAGKFFPDLYIEENEKFDSLITMSRLIGAEINIDRMENTIICGVNFDNKGYFEIERYIGKDLSFDYRIVGLHRNTNSHNANDIELLLERIEGFIVGL